MEPKDEIPVKCPCCQAVFMFPSGHPVHQRNQLTLDLIREISPEISEEDELC